MGIVRQVVVLAALAGLLAAKAAAAVIPVGFLSVADITPGPQATFVFTIQNQTGVNASAFPDPTWPVVTPLDFNPSGLLLTFSNASTFSVGSGFFGSALPDGSYISSPFSVNPATTLVSAMLTGTFSPASVSLNDGSTSMLMAGFTTTLADPVALFDGDFVVIDATVASPPTPAPEPWSLVFCASGLLALASARRRARGLVRS